MEAPLAVWQMQPLWMKSERAWRLPPLHQPPLPSQKLARKVQWMDTATLASVGPPGPSGGRVALQQAAVALQGQTTCRALEFLKRPNCLLSQLLSFRALPPPLPF